MKKVEVVENRVALYFDRDYIDYYESTRVTVISRIIYNKFYTINIIKYKL